MRVDPLVLLAQDTQIAAAAIDKATRADEVLDALPAQAAAGMAQLLRRAAFCALTTATRLQNTAIEKGRDA